MNHSFLIGTHAGLFNLILDQELEVISCKKLANGHHYGLSIDMAAGIVYSKNKDDFFNVLDLSSLQVKGKVEFQSEPGHVHQALVVNKGIYLTDTIHNRLTFQSESGENTHLNIDGHHEDVNHLNSLFLFDNEIACLLHNRGAVPTEVMTVSQSKGQGLVPSRRWSIRDYGCHNLYIDGAAMCYNASEKGHFVKVHLGTGKDLTRKRFSGHSKGLSVIKDYMVIGVSDHAKREERIHTSSSIVIMHRQSLQVIKEIPVRSDEGAFIGNINELRCISEKDYSEGKIR